MNRGVLPLRPLCRILPGTKSFAHLRLRGEKLHDELRPQTGACRKALSGAAQQGFMSPVAARGRQLVHLVNCHRNLGGVSIAVSRVSGWQVALSILKLTTSCRSAKVEWTTCKMSRRYAPTITDGPTSARREVIRSLLLSRIP